MSCRSASAWIDDCRRWCGMFVAKAFDRLAAAAMTRSSGVTAGLVIYLCLKNAAPNTQVAHVSFDQNFQHQ